MLRPALSLFFCCATMTAIALAMGPPRALADTNCDARLKLLAEQQAATDFPGRQVVIKAAPTTNRGHTFVECIEICDGENPARVLGVYTTLIDEVCELNDGFSPQPTMTVCPAT